MSFRLEQNFERPEKLFEEIDQRIAFDMDEVEYELPSASYLLEVLANREELGLTIQEIKSNLILFAEHVYQTLGIEAPPAILFAKLDEEHGFFNPDLNCIVLNENDLNNMGEMLDTVIHEIRHKYQYECASLPKDEMYEYGQVMKKNIENYISARDNYIGYYFQPMETDAREFAINYLNTLGYTKGEF